MVKFTSVKQQPCSWVPLHTATCIAVDSHGSNIYSVFPEITLQLNLRLPGEHNPQITLGIFWSIFGMFPEQQHNSASILNLQGFQVQRGAADTDLFPLGGNKRNRDSWILFSTVSAVYGIMKDAKLTRQLTDLNKQRVRQVKREEKVLLRLKHMWIYH